MSTTTYPNGQVLTSSAKTPQEMNAIFQPLTMGVLGLWTTPPDYSLVRVNWQTQGQPFSGLPSQDVCYLACTPIHEEYSNVREYTQSAGTPLTETWTYTRPWRIAWVLYGANSSDRVRMLWSATFTNYFNDQLAAANLYPLSEFTEPTRMPEQINAEWWERADFAIDLYEQVTEVLTTPTGGIALSVENLVYTADGLMSDSTVAKP